MKTNSESQKCSNCGIEKLTEDFNWRITGKSRHKKCKICHAEYRRKHYEKQKPYYINRAFERTKRQREILRKIIWDYLSTHHCVDCGQSNPITLDFDHVRGEKRQSIGYMLQKGVSVTKLNEEIAKCEVRCANCHRIKTASQHGNWRLCWGNN